MTANKPGRFFLLGLFLTFVILVADQYSKWFVMETILRQDGAVVPFIDWLMTQKHLSVFFDQRESYNNLTITSFLNLVMVWNTGVSFGLFNSDSQTTVYILTALALLMSMLMLVWMAVTTHRRVLIALAMVTGGAIGNAIDRVRFGAVADFVDVHVAGWHWPAFNLADSAIVLGAILMILEILLNPQHGSGKLK